MKPLKHEAVIMEFAGKKPRLPEGIGGFTVYTLGLIAGACLLPPVALQPGSHHFIFLIGTLATWRYSWGLTHFVRALIYQKHIFPRLRARMTRHEETLMPSHIYLLITSFRIDSDTSIEVYRAAIREAMQCGIPATIVASLVESADETIAKQIFRAMEPPPNIHLKIVRIPGSGKRDGLAQGFRAISRDAPAPDAVVAVIDGDSILGDGLIRKTAGFFSLMPDVGALTTDEECDVQGSNLIRQWHDLRFAQRQLLMSSMGLSRRVLTLTGRMSMFRAEIIINPGFIEQVENDYLDHWRFGRLQFLTGDDKSSWYWLLKNGWQMLYIPDVSVKTVEHPPSPHFFVASTLLMRRWFGNMLRTNERALAVPPHIAGFFTWWCLLDQRISMWTTLTGPVFVTLMCFKYSIVFLPIYLVWIGFTRWIMSILLLFSRWKLSGLYPFLIYYNQIYGSLIKTWVLFRLDRQSWTRQKTTLSRNGSALHQQMTALSSHALHALAMVCFVSVIGIIADIIHF
jgi:glycosyltransferase Alg8